MSKSHGAGWVSDRRTFLSQSGRFGLALALGAGGLSTLLSGCVGTAQQAPQAGPKPITKVDFQFGFIADAQQAGWFAADAQGYLQEEGLQVTFQPGGPNVDSRALVASGRAFAGDSSGVGVVLGAIANGAPLKIIFCTLQRSPAGLISLAKAPIRSMKDAVGKKIGLQTGARGNWGLLVKKAGLNPESFNIVPVGADAAPLVQGQVDAFWGFATNQVLALKRQGVDAIHTSEETLGVQQYGGMIFATDKVIKEQKDLLVGLIRGYIKGLQYNEQNPDAITKLVVEKYTQGLDLDLQTQVNRAALPYIRSTLTEQKGLGWWEKSQWDSVVRMMVENQLIPSYMEPEKYLNEEIIAAAYGGKNKL